MGLHSQKTGRRWLCFPVARGAWVRCHSPVFPLLQSQALLHPSTLTPQDLNCQEEVDYLSCACLGHLHQLEATGRLGRAVRAASGVAGRSRGRVPACLVRTVWRRSTGGFLVRDYSRPRSFRSQLIPFSQAYPPATFPQSLRLRIEAQARPQRTSPSMMTSPL